jgi:hypothetical protein
LKEQIRYTAKRSNDDNAFYVCEHRDIKDLFWEKLELQHFPCDVQDLSISIASMLYDDKVLLTADPNLLSGVNREAFVDQQEWSLYEHVDAERRYVTEFLLIDDEDHGEESDETTSEGRVKYLMPSRVKLPIFIFKRHGVFIGERYIQGRVREASSLG